MITYLKTLNLFGCLAFLCFFLTNTAAAAQFTATVTGGGIEKYFETIDTYVHENDLTCGGNSCDQNYRFTRSDDSLNQVIKYRASLTASEGTKATLTMRDLRLKWDVFSLSCFEDTCSTETIELNGIISSYGYELKVEAVGFETKFPSADFSVNYTSEKQKTDIHSVTVSNTYTINCESTQDLGVIPSLTPKHGGDISRRSFRVESDVSDVRVVFSDTNTSHTSSEDARLIAVNWRRECIPGFSSYAPFNDLEIEIHRMHYKVPVDIYGSAYIYCSHCYCQHFPEITGNGINDDNLKGTYITPINISLPNEQIENIVFIADGQQKVGENLDHPSAITGHPDGFKDQYLGFGWGEVHTHSALENSLYSRLRQTNWFPLNKTYWIHADDHQYWWGFLSGQKSKIRTSYTRQICSKVGPNTKRIYLAGVSRGGALVLEMAQRIKDEPDDYGCPNMDDIYVYVQSFDGVFHAGREFNVERKDIKNPLLDDFEYEAQLVDISAQYSNKQKLKIWSDISGQDVIQLFGIINIADVNAFTHDSEACRNNVYCFLDVPGNEKWYQQLWGTFTHSEYMSYPNHKIIEPALDVLAHWLSMEREEPDINAILALLLEPEPLNVNRLVNFQAIIPEKPWTASGCPDGFSGGKYSFTGRLKNISDQKGRFTPQGKALTDVLVKIQKLKDHMLMIDDGELIAEARRFAVPRIGGYVDGVLRPSEEVDVPFSVCLRKKEKFELFVNVLAVQ